MSQADPQRFRDNVDAARALDYWTTEQQLDLGLRGLAVAVKDRKGECVGAVLDPDKIFLVQLADFMWNEIKSVEERIDTARHFRVFPGEGVHSEQLTELVMRLDRLGYRGDYSFEVFNDDYQGMPLPLVAERARRAAEWLGEDVLRRSVPLPGELRLKRAAVQRF